MALDKNGNFYFLVQGSAQSYGLHFPGANNPSEIFLCATCFQKTFSDLGLTNKHTSLNTHPSEPVKCL